MHYATATSFTGPTASAFDRAVAMLGAAGFRLIRRDDRSLEMVGEGMHSTRQSPLRGATRIQLVQSADELALEADLGGVERMSRFLKLFPSGLSLGLAVLFVAVFGTLFGPRVWLAPIALACGGNALLWLILGPWMARGVHRRTCQALDNLLVIASSGG